MALDTCTAYFLGTVGYRLAWEIQNDIADQIKKNSRSNTILLLQHPSVYTIGRRGSRADIFLSDQELKNLDIDLIETDRGGEVTYHGPGQMIVYPIIDIRKLGGPSKLVGLLESTIIDVLGQYQLDSFQVCERIGVWISSQNTKRDELIDEKKIAAIGLRFSQGISTHGFALNVNPDLRLFGQIVPCGIKDRGVTSLAEELGKEVDYDLLTQRVIQSLSKYLGVDIVYGSAAELFNGSNSPI